MSTSLGHLHQTLDTDADFVSLNCGPADQKSTKVKKRKQKITRPHPKHEKFKVAGVSKDSTGPLKRKNKQKKGHQKGPTEATNTPVFFFDVSPLKVNMENPNGQQSSSHHRGPGKNKRKKKVQESFVANASANPEKPTNNSPIDATTVGRVPQTKGDNELSVKTKSAVQQSGHSDKEVRKEKKRQKKLATAQGQMANDENSPQLEDASLLVNALPVLEPVSNRSDPLSEGSPKKKRKRNKEKGATSQSAAGLDQMANGENPSQIEDASLLVNEAPVLELVPQQPDVLKEGSPKKKRKRNKEKGATTQSAANGQPNVSMNVDSKNTPAASGPPADIVPPKLAIISEDNAGTKSTLPDKTALSFTGKQRKKDRARHKACQSANPGSGIDASQNSEVIAPCLLSQNADGPTVASSHPSDLTPIEPNVILKDDAETQQSAADVHPGGKKRKKDRTGKKGGQSANPETANGASESKLLSGVKALCLPPKKSMPTPVELEQFILTNKITYEPAGILTEFPPILAFNHARITSPLEKAFQKFQKPSPIQSAVWPVLMAKRDVVGIAETGSGKTLAFGIPAFEHILSTPSLNKGPAAISVLVIAPTRELAMQTESTLSELGKLMKPAIRTLCVYGGVDKNAQRKALQPDAGVRVVVGTPGRLLDLANEGHLKLNHVSWLVLDEADRMLDKGFENDIRAIINLCLPSRVEAGTPTRLTAMFSATWPLSVRRLASDFMHDPVRILVGDDQLSASGSVEQMVEVLKETRGKEFKLLSTLTQLGKSKTFDLSKDKIIVFALYKKEAQRLHKFLLNNGFAACCIEGDMSQDKRTKSLEDFKSGNATMLVATDVAARGLDIPKVEVVINVTFPLTIEDYIHRIGRTGRAGRTGKSITFFTENDKIHAGELMRVLKDANQVVPEDLKQWGGQIKKKTHAVYGDHWKDVDPTVKAKKTKFD